jgi:hypothetical protein
MVIKLPYCHEARLTYMYIARMRNNAPGILAPPIVKYFFFDFFPPTINFL